MLIFCPGWDSNLESGGKQLAVSGNILDHTAMYMYTVKPLLNDRSREMSKVVF